MSTRLPSEFAIHCLPFLVVDHHGLDRFFLVQALLLAQLLLHHSLVDLVKFDLRHLIRRPRRPHFLALSHRLVVSRALPPLRACSVFLYLWIAWAFVRGCIWVHIKVHAEGFIQGWVWVVIILVAMSIR